MRIFGKERDYYDSALYFTAIERQKWTRIFNIFGSGDENETSESFKCMLKKIEFKNFKFKKDIKNSTFFDGCEHITINSGLVFFAGKIYPFIKVDDGAKRFEVFYSKDRFLEKLKLAKLSHILELERTTRNKYFFNKPFHQLIDHLFEDKTHINTDAFHLDMESPVMICEHSVLEKSYHAGAFKFETPFCKDTGLYLLIGGRLTEYQFIKVFSPYLFVQELEMFMGNIMVTTDPMPIFSNKVKLESHGFDNKISFRKRK